MADEQTVTAMSERDAAAAQAQPKPAVPSGWEDHVFLTPELPGEMFRLRNVTTMEEHGPFMPDDFVTDPATGITTAHEEDGHPFVLRVQRQWHEDTMLALECVDDDGDINVLYSTFVPDNTLEIEEPEFSNNPEDPEFD